MRRETKFLHKVLEGLRGYLPFATFRTFLWPFPPFRVSCVSCPPSIVLRRTGVSWLPIFSSALYTKITISGVYLVYATQDPHRFVLGRDGGGGVHPGRRMCHQAASVACGRRRSARR